MGRLLLALVLAAPALCRAGGSGCADDAGLLQAQTLAAAGVRLPVVRHFCYQDRSGSYVLYLAAKSDRQQGGERLSSMLQAHLLKRAPDGALAPQWTVRDFAASGDAGGWFSPRLQELADLDGDGLIEPLLVYRFSPRENEGLCCERIKLVMFYHGRKVAIRAESGEMDGSRSTVANAAFFSLPGAVRRHLVDKMEAMYRAGDFTFDNSYRFVPRRDPAE
ncbi:M949_RS01915 family surface polysaccharide biosynthesis protein [Chromobacterium sp. ATCC 53434]|nr:hypothetical protein [Chromobacterium sp. ATCC 53434]